MRQNMIHRMAARPTYNLQVEIAEAKTTFSHKKNVEFFEWWSQVRDGDCPYRRQFDIVDHPRWAANVFLVRVESSDPWAFRFQLIGNGVIDMLGRNDTGVALSESAWDTPESVATRAYVEMMQHRRPVRFSGSLAVYDRDYIDFESIDAPFLGEDGTVSTVIGLICRLQTPPGGR